MSSSFSVRWSHLKPPDVAGRQLAGLDGRRIVAALQRGGPELVPVTGSHHVLRKPGSPGSKVIVPAHGARDVPVGTVVSIAKQSGRTAEEFAELL
jgi:predicted RNA binding protein YcfA (HicA-like mRNA interferase family)